MSHCCNKLYCYCTDLKNKLIFNLLGSLFTCALMIQFLFQKLERNCKNNIERGKRKKLLIAA